MSTLAESLGEIKKPWQWLAIGGAILLIWGAIAIPTLHRSREFPDRASQTARLQQTSGFYAAPMLRAKPVLSAGTAAANAELKAPGAAPAEADAAAGRKIIRTSSMELVVPHPGEAADKITELAESMGGYLASADGGGQNATTGTLTIRVPAARFEEARTQIRKLGLRVENERIDAQDVTRQYVDQDASIRNLRAEEAQYLAILKQATTVKDLLAVSEQLSQVRGQIEQQQAEFNALSKQIETVAIAISLRTEPAPNALGWNWHPGDQLKLALHDGLDSLAAYATAMTAILFYLPAALLWVGTIVLGIVLGWRLLRWVGRRWFGWAEAALNS
jgi:hypothetical protein